MANKPKDDNKEQKEDKKKKVKEEKKEAPKKPVYKMIEGVKGIVRIGDSDVIGTKKVKCALLNIKGISHSVSKAIISISRVDPNQMIGAVSDDDIKRIEDIAANPIKYGIKSFIINRKGDMITGEDVHLLSSDLTFVKKSDIDSMKKMQCYKGVRHQAGLPCRGQHTRSSFRTGVRMGVTKKKQAPGAAAPAAPAPAAKPEKK